MRRMLRENIGSTIVPETRNRQTKRFKGEAPGISDRSSTVNSPVCRVDSKETSAEDEDG